MKKQIPAVILALVLCMGLAVPAFAADDPKPVTIGNITLSDVIVTDEYDTAQSIFGEGPAEHEFLYDLGNIGFLIEETQEYGYSTFWCYLVPEDATISMHVTKDIPECVIYAYTLEEVEGFSQHSRAWQATWIDGFSTNPLDGREEMDASVTKEFFEEYQPEFDLLRFVMGDEDILVWFGGPDAESAATPAPVFTDVDDGIWYAEHVAWAIDEEITLGTGNGKFSPDRDCSHIQILTFLWRAADKPSSTATAFDHLAGDYAPAANWAYETGMIGDSFDPQAPCTRSDAVNYIWQAFGSVEAEAEADFTDMAADADYAAAVAWAVEKGVAEGYPDGTFHPDTVCNRATIVTLLHRAYIKGAQLNANG